MTPELTLHQVLDSQHGNAVAWAFEAPSGWQVRSRLDWNYQHVSFPVTSGAQAFDPQSGDYFEILPPASLCWVEPNYGMMVTGQNTLGQTIMQPLPATDALVRVLIPQTHGRRPDLRILGVGPVADLAQTLGLDLKGAASEGCSARVTYAENGQPVEEEWFGVKVQQDVPFTGPMGTMIQTNWGFARAFRYRTAADRLDGMRNTFWSMARSIKINPAWERVCAEVMQQLQVQFNQLMQAGYQQIQAAGQLSRSISANNDAMLANFEHQRQAEAQSYAVRRAVDQAASQRSTTDGFDEYIRGVETVKDPYWGESQQDANYRYHWTDGSGSYKHSNDPFFNPNIGGTQNWQLMEPK